MLNEKHIVYIKKNFNSSFRFRLLLLKLLPMGYLSGMRVKKLDNESCSVTIRYKWLNKNPFKSTFWAVQGMAAEMCSGALLTMYTFKQKPSIAMLVVHCNGTFVKKAIGKTTFECKDGEKIKNAVVKAMETKEAQSIECLSVGRNEAGEEVAHFTFTWSIKARNASN